MINSDKIRRCQQNLRLFTFVSTLEENWNKKNLDGITQSKMTSYFITEFEIKQKRGKIWDEKNSWKCFRCVKLLDRSKKR